MGQSLSIGIATDLSISKQKIIKNKITKPDLLSKLQNYSYLSLDIYDITETEDYISLILKDNILAQELMPFIEKFYRIMYDDNDADAIYALKKLQQTPSIEWMQIAQDKDLCYFQQDKYGEDDILYFNEPFRSKIHVYYTCIMLAAQGKIIMETYDEMFRFFKYCIKETFKEFALSGALRVYITG